MISLNDKPTPVIYTSGQVESTFTAARVVCTQELVGEDDTHDSAAANGDINEGADQVEVSSQGSGFILNRAH